MYESEYPVLYLQDDGEDYVEILWMLSGEIKSKFKQNIRVFLQF